MSFYNVPDYKRPDRHLEPLEDTISDEVYAALREQRGKDIWAVYKEKREIVEDNLVKAMADQPSDELIEALMFVSFDQLDNVIKGIKGAKQDVMFRAETEIDEELP